MTDFSTILGVIESHASASGWFESVNGHEPKSAPTVNGLTCAVWADRIRPVPTDSGLAATTGLVVFNARLYTSMLSEPQDAIDPNLLSATNALMVAYSGDFELGGNVRNIDLLGQTGFRLESQAGYITIDNKVYRVMTITVPVIVNDMWGQAA